MVHPHSGPQAILAIDQGTTGSTALLVAIEGPLAWQVLARATVDFPQHFPKPGWVEHDLDEIWGSVRLATQTVLADALARFEFRPAQIAAIGITNQRETLCTFERKTTVPRARAIVWQCRRSHDLCLAHRASGRNEQVQRRTGLVLDPYFTGTKIEWLLRARPDLLQEVSEGKVVFGTIDTFLMARLTGGRTLATEPSNASRTMLYDLQTGQFAPDLAELFGIPAGKASVALPEIHNSCGTFGKTQGLDFLPDGIPITGVLGDQQAALAGQACFAKGEAKCTYGTGAFLLWNTGTTSKHSQQGLLTTVAWSINGTRSFAIEGSSFIAGAAVQYARDQLGWLTKASDSEDLARNAVAAPHVYFVPALAGLGAPYWDPAARGAFLGLTRGTSRRELLRAVLEGIAFSVSDLVAAFERDSGARVAALRVDGGAAANSLLMQIQADFGGFAIDRPQQLETTAFGAALFAALGLGVAGNLEDLRQARRVDRIFDPDSGANAENRRKQARGGWSRALEAVRLFGSDQTS